MGKLKTGTRLLLVLGIILVNDRVSARKWSTDKDSVIVDAQYTDDEEGELHFDALMDEAEQPECLTLDHEPGMCVTMRKCHPILFGNNGELRNPSLAEDYSQSVDTCGTPNKNGVEDEPVVNENGDDMEDIEDDMVRSAVPSANKAAIGDKLMCCARDKIPHAQRSLDDVEEESGATFPPTTALPVVVALGGEVEQAVTEELLVIDSAVASAAEPLVEVVESTGRPETVQNLSEPVDVSTDAPVPVVPEVQPSSSPVPVAASPSTEATSPEVPSSPSPVPESSSVSIPVEAPVSENEVTEDEHVQQNEQTEACPAVSLYNTWPSFENYPFLAAIQVRANTGPLCSGSLIDDRHILTAAHCLHRFNSKDVARMQVRLGFTKNPHNDTFNDFYTERKASKIIFHKRFHEQSKMDNNIALIQLDEPVEFDVHVAPIGIFSGARGFDSGSCAGVEAGWIKYGNRKVTGISGGVIQYVEPPMSDFVLREAINKIFTNVDCQTQLYTEITDDMLCAKTDVFEARGVAAEHFRGNDGGPLVIRVGDRVQQVGIKSWAYEGHQYPTVYTRVDKYLSWIRDNLEM